MFVDIAKIKIKAGDGGAGAVAFHREKYVAAGGPDGGDGGKGGDVVFVVDDNLATLADFRYKRKYAAKNGLPGEGGKRHGKNGESLEIRVPRGTVIKEVNSGAVMADMSKTERFIAAHGGKGGWGNQHFATPTRQVPRFSKPGIPGEEWEVSLELKLLADVGLLGYPSVGKSSLISVVSEAKPKIGDYHFTTLEPNLGVVKTEYGDGFVIADIPGIIEGASEGIGLGTQFLRHVERTRLLLHVIDVAGTEGRNPIDDFNKINEEIKKYSEKLSTRKQIIVANKIDSMQDDKNLEGIEKVSKEKNIEVFKISAVTGEGLNELFNHVADILKTLPKEEVVEIEDRVIYTLEDEEEEFTVTVNGNEFIVEGPAVERLMGRVNIQDRESMHYFNKQLIELGIEGKLKE